MRDIRKDPVLDDNFDPLGRPKYEVYNYLISVSTLTLDTFTELAENRLSDHLTFELNELSLILGRKVKADFSHKDELELHAFMKAISQRLAKEMVTKRIVK